ncbi:MAG: ABC transporter substrate-binding protein [Candidatus Thorarchaeota archaeon]
MRIRSVAIVFLFCALLTFTSVQNTSAEPSELKLGDTYSGPYVDKVMYKIIPNENNRVQALLDGQIDILDGPISSSHLSTLDANPDIELSSILRNGYGQITINCAKNPLNYSVLRRAFAFAFNKTMVPEVVDSVDQLHDSLVPYVSTFCIENDLDWYYYNDQSALGNQMLGEAGFAIDGGTGFRLTPFGDPFSIVLEYFVSSPYGAGVAQLCVDALSSLNIEASSSAEDFHTIITKLDNHGDYDMVYYETDFFSKDVDWLASEYYSANAAVPYMNPTNFANTTYDSYRNQLLYSPTYEEVYNASREMQKILHHNVPRLVVYENTYYSAYRTDSFEGQVVDITKNIANEWTNLKAHLNLLAGGPFSGTLRVSMNQEPDSFNPMVTVSPYSKSIFDNIFNTLLRIGPDGQRRLDLAESYLVETHDTNPAVPVGHTRFTFDILQNASWSDGTPLIADDVAYTFTYYNESMAYGNPMGIGLVDLVGIYAPTHSMVVMEFNSESYWLLSTISELPILQRNLLQSIGYSGWNTWNPVFSSDPYPTSGPFNLTDNSAGNYVELSYNPIFQHGVRGIGSDMPEVTGPSDMVVVQGTSGSSISWTYTDDNPLVCRILNNGSAIDAEYCSTSTIELDVDAQLSTFGIYNFTFEVKDWEYQRAVDTVIVEYLPDTFAPEVTGPGDFFIGDVLSSGTFITWTVFDHNPANYTILLDGEYLSSDDWIESNTSISHDIGSLSEAEYNFTILLQDFYGNNSTDTVIVTVVSDTVPPELVGPEDIVMTVGELGMYIQWNASDLYPYTFEIHIDDTLNTTGSWESDIPIVFSLDGFETGIYNVTIHVMDVGGNIVSDSVNVRVVSPSLIPTEMLLLSVAGIAIAVLIVAFVKLKGRR